MNWPDKLRNVIKGKNAAELAVSKGLHKSAIRDAINTGQEPRARKAVKIAAAVSVPPEWLWDDEKGWPPPIAPEPPSLRSISDLDLIQEFLHRRALLRKETASLNDRLSLDALEHLLQLAGKPDPSREEQEVLDRGFRDAIAFWSARAGLVLMTPRIDPEIEEFTDAQAKAMGRFFGRLRTRPPYDPRAMPFDLRALMDADPLSKLPARRRPTEEREAQQGAPGKPSDNLRSPGITSPGDSTHPTNADRLGKRPTGRKRRKAESP